MKKYSELQTMKKYSELQTMKKYSELQNWRYETLRDSMWRKPSENWAPDGMGTLAEEDPSVDASLSDPQRAAIRANEDRALLAYPLLNRLTSPSGIERAALRDYASDYQPRHFLSRERWNRKRTLRRYAEMLCNLDEAAEYKSTPISRLTQDELDRIANSDYRTGRDWVNSWLPDKGNPHYNRQDQYLLNAHLQAMSRAAQAELKRRRNSGEM